MSNKTNAIQGPIRALADMRAKCGQVWTRRKKALLTELSASAVSCAKILRQYHDVLLFLTAFPDDAQIHRLAQSELRRLAKTIRLSRESGGQLAQDLLDTGIADTDLYYTYSLPVAQWLAERFPDDVELALDDEAVMATFDQLGHIFLPHIEQDSMLTDRMSAGELFELGKGTGAKSLLAWIISRYDRLEVSSKAHTEFFDLLNLQLRWTLRSEMASRTFVRFAARRTSYAPVQARIKAPFARLIQARLPAPERLSLQQAHSLIDVARATLTARHRETESTTYPNTDEVTLFRLAAGVDVAIFGMAPERRLAIESFFGFVAAKNGVPVAYGGGFVYLDRLDIGLNIFREYRGGGSAFVFSQILRAFSQHYRAQQIIIDSAQFGYGRAGGIQSGAFWFYYRLGFRPVNRGLADLAVVEWGKIQSQPGYRTPASTLRKLAESNLAMNLGDGDSPPQALPLMADIALAVTRNAAQYHNGDRTAQGVWARRRVKRLLGAGNTRSWPDAERQSFTRMCTLIALIPDLGAWSDRQKSALVALMRAKGGRLERRYVLMSQRHRKLARALARLAAVQTETWRLNE